jgi:hypothetical protein
MTPIYDPNVEAIVLRSYRMTVRTLAIIIGAALLVAVNVYEPWIQFWCGALFGAAIMAWLNSANLWRNFYYLQKIIKATRDAQQIEAKH